MNNIERAAIILLGMEKDKASEVLKHLDTEDIEKLAHAMQKVSNSDSINVSETIQEFLNLSQVEMPTKFARALDKKKEKQKEEQKSEPVFTPEKNLDDLKSFTNEQLIEIISEEHPQVIAVIMNYISSEQAAELMTTLDEKTRVDVIKRLATVNTLSSSAVKMLNNLVAFKINNLQDDDKLTLCGLKNAAAIINFLDTNTENLIINELDSVDTELSERIQNSIFNFENLASMSDRNLRTLLKSVSEDTLLFALKAADESLVELLLKNAPKQVASAVKTQLETEEPVRLYDIMEAQKSIITLTQKLIANKEIVLESSGVS